MALADDELNALLADLESDRVERKESAGNTDKIAQAICAFANDLPGHREPGVLFVGVKDDGSPAGTPITDQLLQNLASYRDQGNILPPPSMAVRKVELPGGEVAAVEVQPSNSPPVRYKGQIWVRVGPRRGVANSEDERMLNERRRSLDLPFDSRPINGATLDDLDLQLFQEVLIPQLVPPNVLSANGRTVHQRLAALRLTSPDGTPTAAGIITIGKDPLQWVPGAWVQFLRIAGTTLADPVKDEKRLDGPLPTVLRQLDEILGLNISSVVDFTSEATERRVPDYPIAALQQVARNAVMHRSYEHTNSPVRITWYEDRVEVVSPGGPFGAVTVDTFGSGMTDYRNPTLAEVMRGLGYVQRFGAGIPTVFSSLARNGNPEPTFRPTESYVAVALRRR
ncbi:RNA-binding domain-containing protein [Saccharothrix coeruleofusca]|uniref:Transcriptional regulator n=1 Tax=Saccharothrix coeruleofusca TaxID=33919 RepID=A0A918EC16_9PSEU|nr:ATP-binding protein [Saccharothrix coeruleofusca]MBP2338695.1 ATP-dependent DNA helicase RecG [Saccharothrix coeruleofusca]GGP46588.1 transcriptional regulator [Saccharothrix coeruleofusca]